MIHYAAVVNHENGTDVLIVHHDERGAQKAVADWARRWWHEASEQSLLHSEEYQYVDDMLVMPDDDGEVIALYFDLMGQEEWWTICETEIVLAD